MKPKRLIINNLNHKNYFILTLPNQKIYNLVVNYYQLISINHDWHSKIFQ